MEGFLNRFENFTELIRSQPPGLSPETNDGMLLLK